MIVDWSPTHVFAVVANSVTNIDGVPGHHHDGRATKGGKLPARHSEQQHGHDHDDKTNHHAVNIAASSSSGNGTRSPIEGKDEKRAATPTAKAGEEILIDVGLAMKQHVRIWRQVLYHIPNATPGIHAISYHWCHV
jgi:hypothetical protein